MDTLEYTLNHLRTELDAMPDLTAGWMDGDAGKPVTPQAIDRATQVVDVLGTRRDSRVVSLFPTECGGCCFYWPDHPGRLTAEVEPSGSIYFHAVDARCRSMRDEKIAAEDDVDSTLERWLK